MEDIFQTQENSGEPSKYKTEGFFILNLTQVDNMVRQGAGAEEVMAFVILSRGVGRNQRASTHGANSIATRTNMTNYRAEQSLTWLVNGNHIQKIDASEEKSKKRKQRWELQQSTDSVDVALANTLMDGIGKGKVNPPLARIYSDVKMGNHCLIADARLDAIMVLLHLYKHHLIADFGGVNPRAGIFKDWRLTENMYGNKIEDIDGTNAAIYEVEGGSNTMYLQFAAESLFYVKNLEERSIRFWDAFKNLSDFGLLYEVLQVWSANPNKDIKAEPLYTLYIHDRHARESEPYLQTAIHRLALQCEIMQFNDLSGNQNVVLDSGKFRFIANKKTGGFPIGIYRLRFRPHTKDTGKGMAAELRRVSQWSEALNRIRKSSF